MTAHAKLDAVLRAFEDLGVRSIDIHSVDMVDRVDRIVVIGVTSYVELAALAAALDMPKPEHRVEGGYAWAESAHCPERGTSITIQAHRPSRHSAA